MIGRFIEWLIYGGIAFMVIVGGIGLMERISSRKSKDGQQPQ